MPERRFVDITREDIPAVYEIGVKDEGTVLKVSIHSSIADFVKDVTGRKGMPLAQYLEKQLEVPGLIGFSTANKTWGFGQVLVLSPEQRPEWITWNCQLPKYKPLETNWNKLYAISATLNLLSWVVIIAEKNAGATVPQLFELGLMTEPRSHAISVKLARAFIPWISRQSREQAQFYHPKIEGPIKIAYGHMAGSGLERFMVYFRPPKWVNLSVPGDACGLDPENYSERSLESGYTLLPHNVDGPIQQLALLMGIAAMHDEARKNPV